MKDIGLWGEKRLITALDLIKCLKQFKLQSLPLSFLPFPSSVYHIIKYHDAYKYQLYEFAPIATQLPVADPAVVEVEVGGAV